MILAARPGLDRTLLAAVIALSVLGALLVYSASAAVALDRTGQPAHYFLRHLIALGVAGPVLWGATRLPVARLQDPRVVWGAVVLVTALLVAVLFAPEINRVHRWLRIGPLSVQPSELAKPVLVVFLADRLARKADRLGSWKAVLLPSLLVLGLFCGLIALQPDIGTPAILVLLFGALLFAGGVPKRSVLVPGAAALLILAAWAVTAEYRMERIRVFLSPETDPSGAGYQVRQSLIAVGSGGILGANREGLLGTGLGAGVQKLFYLPYPHTDFIFAVAGEELGLAGTAGIVALYLLILWRGFRAAARTGDRFTSLLAAGFTMVLVGQALLNMGVVLDLLPTKGVPLPFVSYGGTSLAVSALSAGLLLSAARPAPAGRTA